MFPTHGLLLQHHFLAICHQDRAKERNIFASYKRVEILRIQFWFKMRKDGGGRSCHFLRGLRVVFALAGVNKS
jgi:hypothetical protein